MAARRRGVGVGDGVEVGDGVDVGAAVAASAEFGSVGQRERWAGWEEEGWEVRGAGCRTVRTAPTAARHGDGRVPLLALGETAGNTPRQRERGGGHPPSLAASPSPPSPAPSQAVARAVDGRPATPPR